MRRIRRLALGTLIATGVLGADRIEVHNPDLSIAFEQQDSRLALVSLCDRADAFDAIAAAKPSPLWELEFRRRGAELDTKFRGGSAGEPVDILGREHGLIALDALSCGAAVSHAYLKRDHRALKIVWDHAALPDGSFASVSVTVTLPPRGKLSFWTLEVTSPSEDYSLWKLRFVRLAGLARDLQKETEHYLQPAGMGQRNPVPTAGAIEWVYPSSCMGMQMSAYLLAHPRKGLFTACYDELAFTKKFHLAEHDGVIGHYWEHYPENMGSRSGDYTLPYPVVLGLFDGDWFEASQIYKAWATKQFWVARGRIANLREIPQWFKDVHFWKRPDGDPDKVQRNMLAFADWFQRPFALQWYCWNVPAFDTLYPDVFPARLGFADAVTAMEGRGIHVFPYLNGLLCDPRSQTWKEGAERWVSKTVEGRKYPYPVEGNSWAYHMCPATRFWQERIHDVALRMADEARPSGLYFDCVGGMDTKLCFDASHGHPLGGGHYWYAGFRAMMERIRKDYRHHVPNAAFTTEEMAEPLIDVFDGILRCTVPGDIPLFNAVYGEYILSLGRSLRWEDWEQDGCFENREAEALTWGFQLGWYPGALGSSENFELAPAYAQRTEFFKTLVAARMAGARYLVYGSMAAPLLIDSAVPTVQLQGSYTAFVPGSPAVVKPVLHHSAWRDEAGRIGLVFANSGRSALDVAYRLDPARYGLRPGRRLMFRTRFPAPAGPAAGATYDVGPVDRVETVRARSVLIVEVSQ